MKIFGSIEKKAHYDYPRFAQNVKEGPRQTFMFHMVRDIKTIDKAMEIYDNFGSFDEAIKKMK